jgi:hypothetical protein
MRAIAVRCDGSRLDGWTCSVTVREGGHDVSSHRVRVRASDLDRLAPGASDPAVLVEASFDFLLARESPQMILRAFDLTDIAHFFPDYETDVRMRLSPPGTG